eukprot:scaffold143901_cov17-Tisochrysis_lutea.AAC.1
MPANGCRFKPLHEPLRARASALPVSRFKPQHEAMMREGNKLDASRQKKHNVIILWCLLTAAGSSLCMRPRQASASTSHVSRQQRVCYKAMVPAHGCRFKPLHETVMSERVNYICEQEKVQLSEESLATLGA